MKDSFKNMFHQTEKKPSQAGVSEKQYKKWFVLARKSVPTTWNEAFFKKYIRKNCFSWHENRRKWFSLARKCFFFKNWLPLVSIVVSMSRKKALNKSILFPLNRKEVSSLGLAIILMTSLRPYAQITCNQFNP